MAGAWRYLVVISLSVLLCVPVMAQQYGFKYYGTERGLTNLAVKALFHDRDGFLWVGTEGGVFRYDGDRFRRYGPADGLPDSLAFSLGEGPDGSVWAGSENGLFQFSGWGFLPVPLPVKASVARYGGIRSDGAGTTYIATGRGLIAAIKGPEDEPYAFRLIPQAPGSGGEAVRGLSFDQGTLWYGCGNRVCHLSGDSIQVLGPETGLAPMQWDHVLRDGDGNLWAQGGRSLMVMRRGASRFTAPWVPLPAVGPGGPILDSAGRLLIPTADGLAVLENGKARMAGRHSGLRSAVYAVLQGRDGSVWAGLAGRGLARWLGYGEWEAYDASDGLSDTVYGIARLDERHVAAGTEAGLYFGSLGPDRWTWRRANETAGIPVHSVRRESDGTLWLGTEFRGAARIDGRTGQFSWFGAGEGLTELSPTSLCIGRGGRLWAGTREGVFVASLVERRFRHMAGGPSGRVYSVVETANGDLWAGSVSGLWRFSQGVWRSFSTADGLLNGPVLAVAAVAPDDLWIGYRFHGRLSRLHLDGGKATVTHIGAGDRAPSGITYFLGFDARNRLWVGTDQGVDVWDGRAWKRYSQDDGLIWNDCDTNGFMAEPGGAVWIGTSAGLARFEPREGTAPPVSPRTVLGMVVLGGKFVAAPGPVAVDYRQNSLVVRFSALAFAREHALVFRYRLHPLFADWRTPASHQLDFPGLPPNTYRLEVQARDMAGGWHGAPAVFEFEVQSPPWTAHWPYLLHGAMVVAAFLLIYWRRARRHKRELEAQRKDLDRDRVVQEAQRHLDAVTHLNRVASLSEYAASLAHEIAQPLSAISANSEVAIAMLDETVPNLAEIRSALADIRSDDGRAIDIVRRMRSFLKRGPHQPEVLDLDTVATQVVNMVSHAAAHRGIVVATELAQHLPSVTGDRVQFQQVILNLINNAMEAMTPVAPARNTIFVRTALHGDGVLLEVEDMGPGLSEETLKRLFEPFYTTKPEGLGMGLSISRSIVEAFGGRISGGNTPRGGAVFRIVLPQA